MGAQVGSVEVSDASAGSLPMAGVCVRSHPNIRYLEQSVSSNTLVE